MGIHLLTGRGIGVGDQRTAPNIIVINQAVAHRLFQNVDPIGRRIQLLGWNSDLTVVGIVADAPFGSLRERSPLTLFIPLSQMPNMIGIDAVKLEVRVQGKSAPVISTVRSIISQIDPNLTLTDVKMAAEQINQSISQELVLAKLITIFGAIALLLVSMGLFAILSYSVVQRTREIGVRLALGAPRFKIITMVLSEGLSVVMSGAVIGLPVTLLLARLIASRLFGVGPTDLTTIFLSLLILVLTGLLASLFPALRASKMQPAAVLREQ